MTIYTGLCTERIDHTCIWATIWYPPSKVNYLLINFYFFKKVSLSSLSVNCSSSFKEILPWYFDKKPLAKHIKASPQLVTSLLWLIGMKKKFTCMIDYYCIKDMRFTCNTTYIAIRYSLGRSDKVTRNKAVDLIPKIHPNNVSFSLKKWHPPCDFNNRSMKETLMIELYS